MPSLEIDADREKTIPQTGVMVRCQAPDGKWGAVDIAHLTAESLLLWLRSDGGRNPLAENALGVVFGHGPIVADIKTALASAEAAIEHEDFPCQLCGDGKADRRAQIVCEHCKPIPCDLCGQDRGTSSACIQCQHYAATEKKDVPGRSNLIEAGPEQDQQDDTVT